MSVLVVGSLNLDAVVRVERLPTPGETVLGSGLAWLPGGKGANQAVAAARQGVATALIGRVGDDEAGRSLTARLAAEGVDTSGVLATPDDATGVALISVDRAGANTIVVAPSANGSLAPADVDGAAVGRATVLVAQLETPVDTVRHAFELARRAGVTTVLNPSPVEGVDAALLDLVDVLVANEHEAGELGVGLPCRAVVVTRGAGGAVVSEDGDQVVVPSYPVDAVDTTGAGDAFCGTLAARLAAGRSLLDAVGAAVAAGALAVTRPGALPSFPTAAEVAALLEEASL